MSFITVLNKCPKAVPYRIRRGEDDAGNPVVPCQEHPHSQNSDPGQNTDTVLVVYPANRSPSKLILNI